MECLKDSDSSARQAAVEGLLRLGAQGMDCQAVFAFDILNIVCS